MKCPVLQLVESIETHRPLQQCHVDELHSEICNLVAKSVEQLRMSETDTSMCFCKLLEDNILNNVSAMLETCVEFQNQHRNKSMSWTCSFENTSRVIAERMFPQVSAIVSCLPEECMSVGIVYKGLREMQLRRDIVQPPGIVRVYGFVAPEEQVHVVMEKLETWGTVHSRLLEWDICAHVCILADAILAVWDHLGQVHLDTHTLNIGFRIVDCETVDLCCGTRIVVKSRFVPALFDWDLSSRRICLHNETVVLTSGDTTIPSRVDEQKCIYFPCNRPVLSLYRTVLSYLYGYLLYRERIPNACVEVLNAVFPDGPDWTLLLTTANPESCLQTFVRFVLQIPGIVSFVAGRFGTNLHVCLDGRVTEFSENNTILETRVAATEGPVLELVVKIIGGQVDCVELESGNFVLGCRFCGFSFDLTDPVLQMNDRRGIHYLVQRILSVLV